MILHLICLIHFLVYLSFTLAAYEGTLTTRFRDILSYYFFISLFCPFSP